jgi:predicted Zn-dependent protease with MMP-like domain
MVKHRRGSRTAARLPRARHDRFDRLVDRAVAGIPSPFREALARMAIVIADEPSPELLRDEGLDPSETLYGIYQPPVDALYSWGDSFEPERIMIFRLPLEEDFPDPDDLADEVRITILHELAHALGIDDEGRLAELGID